MNKLFSIISRPGLLAAGLISCMLEKDDEQADKAIDKLLNSITRRASLGKNLALAKCGDEPASVKLIEELEKAIRTEAITLVADLRRGSSGQVN